jgi:hypothetical protein
MSDSAVRPEQAMAALFEGLTRLQRIALLGRLEMAGGHIYRALAADEKNKKAREAFLKAAEDEERNGGILRGMSTSKDKCEKCGKLLATSSEGLACSFQCTFCEDCAEGFRRVCPNCGGPLEARAELQTLI